MPQPPPEKSTTKSYPPLVSAMARNAWGRWATSAPWAVLCGGWRILATTGPEISWRRAAIKSEGGDKTSDICRKMGISQATFYMWKRQYAGLGVQELREQAAAAADLTRSAFVRSRSLAAPTYRPRWFSFTPTFLIDQSQALPGGALVSSSRNGTATT